MRSRFPPNLVTSTFDEIKGSMPNDARLQQYIAYKEKTWIGKLESVAAPNRGLRIRRTKPRFVALRIFITFNILCFKSCRPQRLDFELKLLVHSEGSVFVAVGGGVVGSGFIFVIGAQELVYKL